MSFSSMSFVGLHIALLYMMPRLKRRHVMSRHYAAMARKKSRMQELAEGSISQEVAASSTDETIAVESLPT